VTIKQRKRRHTRRRAHAAGVSRAIGRPQPRRMDAELRSAVAATLSGIFAADRAVEEEAVLKMATVAQLQALLTQRGVEYRAKDRKADLIAKIMAAPS
jgi:hypothetical protein